MNLENTANIWQIYWNIIDSFFAIIAVTLETLFKRWLKKSRQSIKYKTQWVFLFL